MIAWRDSNPHLGLRKRPALSIELHGLAESQLSLTFYNWRLWYKSQESEKSIHKTGSMARTELFRSAALSEPALSQVRDISKDRAG